MQDAKCGKPIQVRYYQHFGADFSRDVPAEGMGGWQSSQVEFDPGSTAIVVLHAWNIPDLESAPGWYSAVEGMQRIKDICRGPLSGLIEAVRASSVPLIHVVTPGDYYQHLPGYIRTIERWPGDHRVEQIEPDSVLERLQRFRRDFAYPGLDNLDDITHQFANLGFPPQATPLDHEPVIDNSPTLFDLCRDSEINHLIYAGFMVNGCIVTMPGGAEDMRRHGLLCSIVADATTAIENHETARDQQAKALSMWSFSTNYGFVLDVASITRWLDGIVTRRCVSGAMS